MSCYLYDLGEKARCQKYGICPSTRNEFYEDYVDVDFSNSTTSFPIPLSTEMPTDGPNMTVGFICCAVAVVFFGLNWVPVKKFSSGDGVFFQFIMCNATLAVGMVVNAIQGFPEMHPLALLSGFLWCTGNMLCVPIIQFMGVGLGILIWNSTNLLMGWASGKWGWFGINPQTPTNITMNYFGVALALLSAILFIAVKPNTVEDILVEPITIDSNVDFSTLPPHRFSDEESVQYRPINEEDGTETFSSLSPVKKRIIGICFSIFSGCMFGFTFTPIIYMQDHPKDFPNFSKNGLDHIFTFYLGIYCTSLFYFLLYCIVKKNKPWMSNELILPSFICGLMWAVGQAAFLLAVEDLSQPVSFPIIASGPGIISAFVGVVFFREITGLRNYLILLLAFVCCVVGAVLSGLSKL